MSNYNACHVEDANRAADCVWDYIEGAPDDDTSLPTQAQIDEWEEDGLITEFESLLLLHGHTVNS